MICQYCNINETLPYYRQGTITSLHVACQHGLLTIVEKLLAHSDKDTIGSGLIAVNVNVKNGEGDTPLHTACREQLVAVVRKLLEHPDVDVNARNSNGETCLHFVRNEEIITVDESRSNTTLYSL
jgi:ankyrin repeat protein